jgi:hypothetical protein
MSEAAGMMMEAIGRWPTGQAVYAAIVAVAQVGASQKMAATMIAAAARGALQGCAAGETSEIVASPVVAQEMVMQVLGVKGLPQALRLLRDAGDHGLAKRVSRQSKTRNGIAHPDVGLVQDLAAFKAKAVSDCAAGDRQEAAVWTDQFEIATNPDDIKEPLAEDVKIEAMRSDGCTCGAECFDIASSCDEVHESKERWADVFDSSGGSADEALHKDAADVDPVGGLEVTWEVNATPKEIKVSKELAKAFAWERRKSLHSEFTWMPLPLLTHEGAIPVVAPTTPQEDTKLTKKGFQIKEVLTGKFKEGDKVWVDHEKRHAKIVGAAKVSASGIFYDVVFANGQEDFFVEIALT